MRLDRSTVRMRTLADEDTPEPEGTAEERILSIWDMTAEIWGIATRGKIDAESRLQRDVVSLTRSPG